MFSCIISNEYLEYGSAVAASVSAAVYIFLTQVMSCFVIVDSPCLTNSYRPILEAFTGLAAPEPVPQACRTDLNHCGDMEDLAGRDPNNNNNHAKKAAGRCCKARAPAVAPVADPSAAAAVASSEETSGNNSCSSSSAASVAVAISSSSSSSTGDQYHRPGNVASLVMALGAVLQDRKRTLHLVAGNTGMGVRVLVL
jgi:hypothetical protein